MGLCADEIAAIDGLLAAQPALLTGGDAGVLSEFRLRFPALSLTVCDLSDIDSELPFRVYPAMSLFLVDAGDHCWKITSDPARATGVVVARHKIHPKGRT